MPSPKPFTVLNNADRQGESRALVFNRIFS
jgi:hypothetical protein